VPFDPTCGIDSCSLIFGLAWLVSDFGLGTAIARNARRSDAGEEIRNRYHPEGHVLKGVKATVLAALAAPGVTVPFYALTRGRATVFMLHRFRDPERGVDGLDPALLRRALGLFRRRRYELVALGELFQRLRGEGAPLKRAVAFTIDDGYAEQAEVAGPLFAEFDCPVTTFVTTGFLDGNLWFWWDRISWVLRMTTRTTLSLSLDQDPIVLTWNSAETRAAACASFVERCKVTPDAEKHAAITRLAEAAEVDLPETPPPDCAPMTWDQLRVGEIGGMTFGPHTVTHPILSMTDDAQSRREIVDSWTRLQAEAVGPVPVFCYPNGGWADFGPREVATLRTVGLTGAVVGAWGIADARTFANGDPDAAFHVRRIAFPADIPHVVQYASGVEVAKLALRGEL